MTNTLNNNVHYQRELFLFFFFPDWLLIIYTNWREVSITFKLFFNLPLNLSKLYRNNVIILCQSSMMMHSKAFSYEEKQSTHSRAYTVQCFFFLGNECFQGCVSSVYPTYLMLNFPLLLEKMIWYIHFVHRSYYPLSPPGFLSNVEVTVLLFVSRWKSLIETWAATWWFGWNHFENWSEDTESRSNAFIQDAGVDYTVWTKVWGMAESDGGVNEGAVGDSPLMFKL